MNEYPVVQKETLFNGKKYKRGTLDKDRTHKQYRKLYKVTAVIGLLPEYIKIGIKMRHESLNDLFPIGIVTTEFKIKNESSRSCDMLPRAWHTGCDR